MFNINPFEAFTHMDFYMWGLLVAIIGSILIIAINQLAEDSEKDFFKRIWKVFKFIIVGYFGLNLIFAFIGLIVILW